MTTHGFTTVRRQQRSLVPFLIFAMLVSTTLGWSLAAQAALINLARNTAGHGFPSPLASDHGWGGGQFPWDLVDSKRAYDFWTHGIAFTGGHATAAGGPPWLEPAGVRQATIDFGESKTFEKVVIWHHGVEYTPQTAFLDYWNGSAWVPILFTRTYGTMHEEGQNAGYADSDIYTFPPVTGSKVRYSFDNSGHNILGTFNIHGWIYEFEVFGHGAANTVAHWKFEEGTADTAAAGNGTIVDSSGNAFNGTPFDGPVYRHVANRNSQLGLEFGNTLPQRVFIPNNPAFELTHSLTLEAFIRYDGVLPGTQYYSQIVFRGDSRGATDPYFLALDLQGHLVFHVEDALNQQSKVISPSPVPLGVPLHVAGTLDDATGEQKLFINGIEVASQMTTIRPFGPLAPFTPGIGIGNVQDDFNHEAFHGIIDEVRISRAALSPPEFLSAATPVNHPPVANADADQTVDQGRVVGLNSGLSQDPDGDPLQYQWKFITKPGRSTAVLSSPTAPRPTFVADLPGTYIAQLIVSDGKQSSAPDTVVITVRAKSTPPRPVITAPKKVTAGDTVRLRVTDPANPKARLRVIHWTLITKPPGSKAQVAGTGQSATFVADVAGKYVVKVVVTNEYQQQGQAIVTIEAVRHDIPPLTCGLKTERARSWYDCNGQQVSQTAYFGQRLSDLTVIRNIVVWQFDRTALGANAGEAYYVNDLRSGHPLGMRQLTQETQTFERLSDFLIHGQKVATWQLTEDARFGEPSAYYAACLVGSATNIRSLTPRTDPLTSIHNFTVSGETARWEFCQGNLCTSQSAALPTCPLP